MIDKTSAANIESMLATIRAYQNKTATGFDAPEVAPPMPDINRIDGGTPKTQASSFGQAIKGVVEHVNNAQIQSSELMKAHQRGEDVPLTDVVLGMQKASLAFEATLQVRNKVLKAYEDILNMPV
ncbi:MAG: flagellar hook-basal body complex protein FliE [Betaproteobacteria bacterium]|jgi:flagellar hook-basal body complex protein FliE|nr:flagellar hook-basal body complex protein FliE [Betaproteobacteria bacterium]NBP43619.1 flagellar hook-basal body complex protein FliE [Betaproteobacteria bacterium]